MRHGREGLREAPGGLAIDRGAPFMYVVHVKKVAASEARKQWFRLLDEAARGETIVFERHGRRLVLRREDAASARTAKPAVDYRRLIRVPHVREADRWSWQWRGPDRPLASRGVRAR